MLFLTPMSGEVKKLRHPLLGRMATPENDWGTPPAGVPWAADCGINVAKSNDPADVTAYLRWLDRRDRTGALFAVCPDVLGNAEACWRRSSPLLPVIRNLGYRVAFAAQDGFDPEVVDWSAFDVLFIGGKPLSEPGMTPQQRKEAARREWKRQEDGGWAAIAEGRRRGKWVHVGRCNSASYVRQVALAGASSADGTTIPLNPGQNWPRIRRTLDGLAVQPSLGLEATG